MVQLSSTKELCEGSHIIWKGLTWKMNEKDNKVQGPEVQSQGSTWIQKSHKYSIASHRKQTENKRKNPCPKISTVAL